MSILVTEPTKLVLFVPQAPEDSQYPVGIWKAARKITGDSSAGTVTMIAAPVSAAEAAKYAWSWEEASIQWSSAGTTAATVFNLTFIPAETYIDGAGNINVEILKRGWSLHGSSPAGIGINAYRLNPGRLFEYICRPDGGLTNSFTLELADNSNSLLIYMFVWGYIWHQQVFTRAGGPRRP